jgi:hypothetical protein
MKAFLKITGGILIGIAAFFFIIGVLSPSADKFGTVFTIFFGVPGLILLVIERLNLTTKRIWFILGILFFLFFVFITLPTLLRNKVF